MSSTTVMHRIAVSVLFTAGLAAHQGVTPVRAGPVDTGGHDPHAHHRAMLESPQPSQADSVEVKLHDLELRDQDGRQVRFTSDVIQDKLIVMDFVYTSCTTVCPVVSAIFGQVQGRLGDRLGSEVRMVSLSVDPTRDVSLRLKAYAARHDAGPGWTWLTGQKSEVDQVLVGLGAYTPNFEDHPSMVLVGDARSGQWVRLYGFPSPEQILSAVDELAAARLRSTSTAQTQE